MDQNDNTSGHHKAGNDNETAAKKDREECAAKRIVNVYAALSASIVAQFIPQITVQLIGVCLFCLVWLATIIMRRLDKDPEGLTKNHMTYLLKTIWVGSLFLTIGTTLGAAYIYNLGDNTVIYDFLNRMRTGSLIGVYDIEGVIKMYMINNSTLIITTAIVSLGPCIVYIIYRLVKGVSRAKKGHRMGNPKAWI